MTEVPGARVVTIGVRDGKMKLIVMVEEITPEILRKTTQLSTKLDGYELAVERARVI